MNIDNNISNNKIDKNAKIYPNVVIINSTIEAGVIIESNSFIKDSIIKENTKISCSYINKSKIGRNNIIGPFSNIRENTITEDNVKIGSFVEVKNVKVKENTKIPHLAYIGDADLGSNINIGAGTIVANYDGVNKNKTIIEDNSFIGSNTTLIAPIKIGKNSFIAAGSTINKELPENTFAIARERQTNKPREDKI